MIQLKNGHTATDPRLGRVPQFDARNARFQLADVLPDAPLRRKTWRLRSRLDQGQESSCVGHGWTHRVNAEPRQHNYDHAKAVAVYKRAQQLDEWSGESYEGTSVLAGAKACRELGWITVYRWASSLDDVLLALSHGGPVVVGTNFYQSMFQPDAKGYLNVTGKLAGGHCYLLRGVDPSRERVQMSNSWGASWGVKGDAYLTFSSLQRLLNEDGDASAPTES